MSRNLSTEMLGQFFARPPARGYPELSCAPGASVGQVAPDGAYFYHASTAAPAEEFAYSGPPLGGGPSLSFLLCGIQNLSHEVLQLKARSWKWIG